MFIKIVRKGFKYMGYINVVYGRYKKIVKKVNVFHKFVLMKMFFLTSFTLYRLRLCDKAFSLF